MTTEQSPLKRAQDRIRRAETLLGEAMAHLNWAKQDFDEALHPNTKTDTLST